MCGVALRGPASCTTTAGGGWGLPRFREKITVVVGGGPACPFVRYWSTRYAGSGGTFPPLPWHGQSTVMPGWQALWSHGPPPSSNG